MIHLLDTNVFMHLANEALGQRNIERHIEVAGVASLRASAITLAELRTKVLRGEGRVKKIHLAKLAVIVSKLVVEDFTVVAAEHAASIMAVLESAGRRNTWPDVLIAGHAASAGYRVVTDDAAWLRIPGLDAVNWRLPAAQQARARHAICVAEPSFLLGGTEETLAALKPGQCGDAGCRGGIRFHFRNQAARPGLDAKARTGMAAPRGQRAGALVEALFS